MGNFKDISGKVFKNMTVIERIDSKWLCKCSCGAEKLYSYSEFMNRKTDKCSKCISSIREDDYFDIIDTQEKAYILGMLTADGCNYENGTVKLDLAYDDVDILNKIKSILGIITDIASYEQPDKIFDGKSYPSKTQNRLWITSKNISEQLKDKGCIKNKSKNLVFPTEDKVPKELYSHYMRGYFDGNGHLGYWIDNPRTGHKKFNMTITSTVNFCEKTKEIFEEFNCKPDLRSRWKERDNNNATVALCGNKVIGRICDWMYKDATIFMDRKYEKYLLLLEQNKK